MDNEPKLGIGLFLILVVLGFAVLLGALGLDHMNTRCRVNGTILWHVDADSFQCGILQLTVTDSNYRK